MGLIGEGEMRGQFATRSPLPIKVKNVTPGASGFLACVGPGGLGSAVSPDEYLLLGKRWATEREGEPRTTT
jgi:hypothetical protein